jgi:hypothetical protein
VLASLMKASCSIALVENFSISRNKSVGREVDRDGGRSPFCGGLATTCSFGLGFGSSEGCRSFRRYTRRAPLFSPTSIRSP